MRVIVDHDRCEGHARCVDLAPRVFRLNDDGQSEVLVDEVNEELRPSVEEAVRLCPRQAIFLHDDTTTANN